jgi:hypothetical protein
VPAVAPAVAPAAPLEGGAPALLVALEPEPEPMVAFVSIHWLALEALAVAPAVPAVPVAPGACSPCCRQPVTVIVRLLELPAVWLVCDELVCCAANVAAHPRAIANVAPVHTRVMVLPP